MILYAWLLESRTRKLNSVREFVSMATFIILDCLFSSLYHLYLAISSYRSNTRSSFRCEGYTAGVFLSISHTTFGLSLCYFSGLEGFTWFVYSCLNLVSVMPKYILCWQVSWFDVKVALYMLVKHFSWSGHFSLFMQLQVLSLLLVGGSRSVLLCLLTIEFTFGIQL